MCCQGLQTAAFVYGCRPGISHTFVAKFVCLTAPLIYDCRPDLMQMGSICFGVCRLGEDVSLWCFLLGTWNFDGPHVSCW